MSFVPPLPDEGLFDNGKRVGPTPVSSLSSAVRLKTVVDKASLAAIAKQLDAAALSSATALATELSNRAVEFLSTADKNAGRAELAKLWTNTKPVTSGSGVVSIQVYNAAEDQVFYLKSNAPNSKHTYPISGQRLLNILINGSRSHIIRSRNPSNPLMFSIREGERQSKFGGIAQTGAGFRIASFRNTKGPNNLFIGLQVNHPGVSPNRFIQAAKQVVEDVAATQGQAIVNAHVGAGKVGTDF